MRRAWLARSPVEVAPDLVGCRLLADAGTPEEVECVLVEVEAYLGSDDPASHAFRGPTPRSAIMFGQPGRLYVYLSHGIHHCANVVCERDGVAGAVLLRAAQVRRGGATVRGRRSAGRTRAEYADSALLSGPGNLCRGLGIARGDNGLDLCAPGSRVRLLPALGSPPLQVTTRIGVTAAADRPLRFAWAAHAAVSRPRMPGPTTSSPSR